MNHSTVFVTAHAIKNYKTRIRPELKGEANAIIANIIRDELRLADKATQEQVEFIWSTRRRRATALKNNIRFDNNDEHYIYCYTAYVVRFNTVITCYECKYLDLLKPKPATSLIEIIDWHGLYDLFVNNHKIIVDDEPNRIHMVDGKVFRSIDRGASHYDMTPTAETDKVSVYSVGPDDGRYLLCGYASGLSAKMIYNKWAAGNKLIWKTDGKSVEQELSYQKTGNQNDDYYAYKRRNKNPDSKNPRWKLLSNIRCNELHFTDGNS